MRGTAAEQQGHDGIRRRSKRFRLTNRNRRLLIVAEAAASRQRRIVPYVAAVTAGREDLRPTAECSLEEFDIAGGQHVSSALVTA